MTIRASLPSAFDDAIEKQLYRPPMRLELRWAMTRLVNFPTTNGNLPHFRYLPTNQVKRHIKCKQSVCRFGKATSFV